MSEIFVEVLLDQNLSKPLDYKVPHEVHVEVGMRVEVPLKSSVKKGTISKIKSASSWQNVKEILKVLSEKTELSDPLWKLAEWMSKYYASPLQRVLKCFIPLNIRKEVKQKTKFVAKFAKTHAEILKAISDLRSKAPLQAETLEKIGSLPKGFPISHLSRSAVSSLVKKKLIVLTSQFANQDLLLEEEFFPSTPKKLNDEQASCLKTVLESIEKKSFGAHLIHGVTGSGKTEIYMQAIQATLNQNQSAIMLVPEISLTSQTIERFKARFSEKIAVYHYKKSLGERTTVWEELKKGEAKLVIGARSALFCPAQNLGLIIVDEEHDSSYKQSDETPCYQGRDTAVMRGYLENCTVILASATPSIESYYNAKIGKYKLHTLKTRATSAPMPLIQIVDMKKSYETSGGFTHFSEELIDGIKKRIHLGEQSLLFLNKRGYHRMQMCKNCRHIIKCPHCDLALTFHKEPPHLACHLCSYTTPPSRTCPICQCQEELQFKGFGTEHVERSLHALFPGIRTLRMDKDTTQKKNSHEELFKQFRSHKADVLIGTQMVAKGFHFPSVTLVGVLNADASLHIPDFRSPEQAFQLLTQVAGRAGRAELRGEVILQTFMPEHPILHLAASQDYLPFYESQIEDRRSFFYPPFCHLIKLLFKDKDPEVAMEKAKAAHLTLSTALASINGQILPIHASGHAKVKDEYRFQFIVKLPKISSLSEAIAKIEGAKIDVDPVSTFF